MKAKFKKLIDILTVLAVTLFFTCWINIIPTMWKPEILDLPLLGEITVRTLLTFMPLLIPTILLKKQIVAIKKFVGMAVLLPLILWGFSSVYYLKGGPALAQQYPLFGIMACYVFALTVESIGMELIHQTFTMKDLVEDILFSLALSLLYYGIITLFGVKPFSLNAIGMSPILALIQLVLAKVYHTPKKHTPKPSSEYDSEEEHLDDDSDDEDEYENGVLNGEIF